MSSPTTLPIEITSFNKQSSVRRVGQTGQHNVAFFKQGFVATSVNASRHTGRRVNADLVFGKDEEYK